MYFLIIHCQSSEKFRSLGNVCEKRSKASVLFSFMSVYFIFIVAGLGFGTMSGLFALINVLDDSGGPGTVGLRDGDSLNYLIMSGMTWCPLSFSPWFILSFGCHCWHGQRCEGISVKQLILCKAAARVFPLQPFTCDRIEIWKNMNL